MTHWSYDFSKLTLWLFFRIGFGLRVRGQHGVPKTGPCIIACNHISFLDPPLLGAVCPRRLSFLARSDLFEHRILGAYLRSVHVIPLQRGESDIGAVRKALDRLRRGEAVAIFPEGGRQRSGQMGMAKRGVAVLARLARVPVVPAFIRGTYEALPPDARGLRKAEIRVAFGTPIPYTSIPDSPTDQLHDGQTADRSGQRLTSRDSQDQLTTALMAEWRRLEQQLQ